MDPLPVRLAPLFGARPGRIENAGSDPTNEPPQVTLISPQPGYLHSNGQDLHFELSLFDKNQPADTLLCKIKSMSTTESD